MNIGIMGCAGFVMMATAKLPFPNVSICGESNVMGLYANE